MPNPTTHTTDHVKKVAGFIEWKSKLYSEKRGGKLMFDVKGHYKWLDESELIEWYNNNRNKQKE